MTIYQEFKPTYLYIKQHSVTGKLYFGKTTTQNVEKYLGSGKLWRRHIKKHGKEYVETLWYCLFYDVESISSFALMCSEQWDIVNSPIWLNLKPENGTAGGWVSRKISETQKREHSIKMTGSGNPNYGKRWNWSEEQKINITGENSKILGRHVSLYTRKLSSNAKLGKNNPNYGKTGMWDHINSIKLECPHCHKLSSAGNAKRWHFDNCKYRIQLPANTSGDPDALTSEHEMSSPIL